MLPTQKIKFDVNGSDSDTAPENKTGFPFLFNVRILSTSGEDTAVTTPNGNTLVPFTLPTGNNTCIGYTENKLTKKGYAFIYNALANHSIIQHDQVTNTIAYVIRNKPSFDSTATPLNFQLTNLITSAFVVERDVNNHLLYWTDNYHTADGFTYNEPKKINIEKGLLYMLSSGTDTAGYIEPFNPHWIDWIKEPPNAPTYVWSGLPVGSNIRNVYATQQGGGDTLNILGSPYPVNFPTVITNLGTDASFTNPVVTLNTSGIYSVYYFVEYFLTACDGSGVDLVVVTVELILNGTTVLVSRPQTISGVYPAPYCTFSCGIALVNTIFNTTDKLELKTTVVAGATGGTTTYTLISHADTANKVDIYFEGATLTNTPNNLFKRLFQFQTQFGFDDKEKSVLSAKTDYNLPATALNPIQSTGEDYTSQDNTITITVETGSEIVTDIYIYGQLLNANNLDTITATSLIVRLNKKDLGIADNTTFNYIFLNDGNYTPLDLKTATALYDFIFYWAQAAEFFIDRAAIANGADNCNATPPDMRFVLDFNSQVQTNKNNFFPAKSYLKSGANYDFPLVYGLNGKRLSQGNTATGMSDTLNNNGVYGTTVHVPFLTEAGYTAPSGYPNQKMSYVPTVKCLIYNPPLQDATFYDIDRSKMKNIESYIQFTSESITYANQAYQAVAPNTAYYVQILISNIIGRYKVENPNSNLVYDWIKGDTIRFIANEVGQTQIDQFFTYGEAEIIAFDNGTQVVTILMNSSIPQVMDNTLFEIYTPSKSVTSDNEIIYEVGEGGVIGKDVNGNKIHIPNNNGLATVNQLFENIVSVSFSANTLVVTKQQIGVFAVNDNVKVIGVNNSWSIYGVVSIVSGSTITINTTGFTMFGTFAVSVGVMVRASVQTFTSGDCFRRYCNMPWVDLSSNIQRLYSYIETMWASNCWTSLASTEAWDYGRPNIINNNQKRLVRSADVSYSEQLIPNTNINGLSTVYDTSIQDYNQAFGGIQRMLFINDRLELYQSLKVFAGLVNQQIIESQSGQPIIAGTTIPLSPQGQYNTYYLANYGTQNPESVATFDFRSYFLDVNNAAVVRRSNNGLTNLPMESNMRIAFANLCTAILQSSTYVNCVGTYDIRYGTYILMVQPFAAYPNGFTIEWNEKANKFGSNWGYSGDYIGQSGNNIISFKNGALWTHDTNAIQSNWYGVQGSSEIWMYLNADAGNEKIANAIKQKGIAPFEVYEISNQEGQFTHLLDTNFQFIENNWYSAIYRDELSPNILPSPPAPPYLPNAIWEGNTMRSRWFLLKFRYNGTNFNKLYELQLQFIPSMPQAHP